MRKMLQALFMISLLSGTLLLGQTLVPPEELEGITLQPVLPTGTIQYPQGFYNYPELPVNALVKNGSLEVVGRLAKPRKQPSPESDQIAECKTEEAECRVVLVALPAGSVVGGKPQYWAREAGSSQWIELKVERKLSVLDENKRSHGTGARAGEYEEFGGFAIEPTFLTWNCAVANGHKTRWMVMSWNGKNPIEFKLRIPFRQCGSLDPKEEEAD